MDRQVATTEQGREILQARINAMQANTVATLDKFQQDTESLQDFIVPLGKTGRIHYTANGHVNVEERPTHLGIYDNPRITLADAAPTNLWTLHPHASTQLAERLNIPGAFLRDLVAGEEWQRQAAANLLESHTQNTDRQRLLFRSVGGELRGVLSDQYRRINSLSVLKTIWDNATAAGALPINAHYTDTRLYAEFLNPQVIAIPTPNNGTRFQAFGLRVTNSDFGDGALDVRFLMIEAVCFNGAVIESAFRQVHLGGRLPDNLEFSERTYRLDSATTASQISDVTRNLLSTERIKREIMKIQEASADVIDVDREMKKLAKGVLGKGEIEQVTRLLSNSRPEDGLTGAATRFKLSQALGTLANQPDTNAVRSRELQEAAGAMLRKPGQA